MIISHKHKYLFVELPRTGSTAIYEELCQHYDGTQILFRHATYDDFLKVASEEEKKYFWKRPISFIYARIPAEGKKQGEDAMKVESIYLRKKDESNQR